MKVCSMVQRAVSFADRSGRTAVPASAAILHSAKCFQSASIAVINKSEIVWGPYIAGGWQDEAFRASCHAIAAISLVRGSDGARIPFVRHLISSRARLKIAYFFQPAA